MNLITHKLFNKANLLIYAHEPQCILDFMCSSERLNFKPELNRN